MEEMERIFLAVSAGQITAAGRWGLPLAHLAYRVGEGPHLYRANSPVIPRGGLMVMESAQLRGGGSVESFCNEVFRECAARRFTGVVCRFRGRSQPILTECAARLGELCTDRGLSCAVSEQYGPTTPDAAVLIPTALSGGTLRRRLEEAVEGFGARRIALWVDRVAEDFTLPSPGGSGAPLTAEELERRREERQASVFFSTELCAHYFTYMAGDRGHFVLFDDAGSIRKKLRLASSLGVATAFLPYETTENILDELLGQ